MEHNTVGMKGAKPTVGVYLYYNFEGHMAPLFLAPVEGLEGPLSPYQVGVLYYGKCCKFFLHDAQNALIQQEMQKKYPVICYKVLLFSKTPAVVEKFRFG